ncbi:hypothetical protein P5V15_007183 [Pogonomyrmex californicus]
MEKDGANEIMMRITREAGKRERRSKEGKREEKRRGDYRDVEKKKGVGERGNEKVSWREKRRGGMLLPEKQKTLRSPEKAQEEGGKSDFMRALAEWMKKFKDNWEKMEDSLNGIRRNEKKRRRVEGREGEDGKEYRKNWGGKWKKV